MDVRATAGVAAQAEHAGAERVATVIDLLLSVSYIDGDIHPGERAFVDGDWKLIHNSARHDGDPEFELYDFIKDPLNKTNVAADHPDIVGRLSKQLEGWHAMTKAARLKPDSETTKTLSPEQLQRLRSLGYVR